MVIFNMNKSFLVLILLGLISISACQKSEEEKVMDDLKDAGVSAALMPPVSEDKFDSEHRDYCSSMKTRGRSPEECQEYYKSEKK